MSLATVCRRLATLVGVQPADTWMGNPDLTASEVVAWVQEAQQVVAAAHDWSTLTSGVVTTLPEPNTDTYPWISVTLPPDSLSRIVPDSVLLDNRRIAGPLTTAEWINVAAGTMRRTALPAYSVHQGKLVFIGAHAGQQLVYAYIAAVPDYASDPQETALGAGVPEFVRMFESCILWSALAAYRDSKGLPAGTAAAQAAASIADARTRDLPIGAQTLVRRHRHHGHGGLVVAGPVTAGLEHALLDDLEPDDDPLSSDFAP
jgi:hypothetical protein